MFATAEYVDMLQELQRNGAASRAVLAFNPQWNASGGDIIDDFGIGPYAAAKRNFVGSLDTVFCFKQLSVFGDRVSLLRAYPGGWQVHFSPLGDRPPVLVGVEQQQPNFDRIVEILQDQTGTRTSLNWVERMRVPSAPVGQPWGAARAGGSSSGGGGAAATSRPPALQLSDVAHMRDASGALSTQRTGSDTAQQVAILGAHTARSARPADAAAAGAAQAPVSDEQLRKALAELTGDDLSMVERETARAMVWVNEHGRTEGLDKVQQFLRDSRMTPHSESMLDDKQDQLKTVDSLLLQLQRRRNELVNEIARLGGNPGGPAHSHMVAARLAPAAWGPEGMQWAEQLMRKSTGKLLPGRPVEAKSGRASPRAPSLSLPQQVPQLQPQQQQQQQQQQQPSRPPSQQHQPLQGQQPDQGQRVQHQQQMPHQRAGLEDTHDEPSTGHEAAMDQLRDMLDQDSDL